MNKKVFFHVDVNSAYLSWESARRLRNGEDLDLSTIPSAITGDPNRRSGIILAKSVLAKKFGVKTGEPINMARKKCPQLYLVSADFDLYVEESSKLMSLLKNYTPDVYQYSIDEAFMDMTGTKRLYGDPVKCADELRSRVSSELGFTINVGIGNSMTSAKMAGDFSKPNKTHTLFDYEVEKKLWGLPIEDLFFVGRRSTRKLRNMGISTIGELANYDLNILKKRLNKYGEIIYNHAHGRDGYEFLKSNIKNKSVGNSMTLTSDIQEISNVEVVLLSLCETVCARLRKKGLKSKVVSVEIVDNKFNRYHKQKTMVRSTDNNSIIYEESIKLFKELWNGEPIRHLGISTSRAEVETYKQLDFFDDISTKEQRLYNAMDSIRYKYGDDSIQRAIFLNHSIGHMEGGTSKNKKNGIIYL